MAKQDQLDMDLMAEAELARLQRQYRIMEGDRRAFYDEIMIKLAKQKRIIDRLRSDKEQLTDDIKVATCEAQKKKDLKIGAKFEILLQKHEAIVHELENERLRLDELDQQIRKTERQVFGLRLKEITDSEYKERIQSGRKSVQMLENKLENTIRRFCCVLTDNKQLRIEIDHLLKERTRFNVIWEKLLSDLNSGKKRMLDLIEQATLAYDQREEWCSKLQALKIRAHNDVIMHTMEMREMQRHLDHEGKLKEFLMVKGQKRVMKDLEERERLKKSDEQLVRERQTRVNEKTFEKIREFCEDERDVEKIAAKYVKQEEENFALFNYVNELNHELESLDRDIREIQGKIEEQKEISEEKSKREVFTLESLQKDLVEAVRVADLDEDGLRVVEDEAKQVLGGIKTIFDLLFAEVDGSVPILDLLKEKPEINEDNVLIYLGLIEKKVSTLITDVYFKEKSLLKIKKGR